MYAIIRLFSNPDFRKINMYYKTKFSKKKKKDCTSYEY